MFLRIAQGKGTTEVQEVQGGSARRCHGLLCVIARGEGSNVTPTRGGQAPASAINTWTPTVAAPEGLYWKGTQWID